MPATKTYRETRDPNVLYNVEAGVWFPRDPAHPLYREFQALQAAGQAELQAFAEPPVVELRRRAYVAAGLLPEALIVALWEYVVEARPEAATAIQAARTQIKTRYPKP